MLRVSIDLHHATDRSQDGRLALIEITNLGTAAGRPARGDYFIEMYADGITRTGYVRDWPRQERDAVQLLAEAIKMLGVAR